MAPLDAWYAGRPGIASTLDDAEMFTIEPPPAARISGIAYLLAHTVPVNAIARMLANVSLSIWSTWVSLPLPASSEMALLTSVVSGPKVSTAARTASATSSSMPLSARMYRARPPESCTAAATSPPRSSDRPVNATAAPSAASIRTTPAPIPRVPPVTSATFPSSRITSSRCGCLVRVPGAARNPLRDRHGQLDPIERRRVVLHDLADRGVVEPRDRGRRARQRVGVETRGVGIVGLEE